MNIFSSPLDLYLAGAHQMNAQKNNASLLSSAAYLSQLNSLHQQKMYSSLMNARQHQAAHLDDPSLYTNDPIKKLKPNNPSSNFMAGQNPYFQEGVPTNREYLNKLALNNSRFPTTGSFDPLKNSQPYQQAHSSQHDQQKAGNVIDLESDDEDCVIVEKPNLNQPPIPVQNYPSLNYHNMPLPDLNSHNYFNGFKTGHFNRPQFNAPLQNNMWSHQNNILYPQNIKLEQSPADFSQQRPVNVSVMNNYNQQGNKAILVEEEESSDDFSNSTANTSSDNKSLTLPPQNYHSLMQMHMLNNLHNFNNNRYMAFNSQFGQMKPVWEQTGSSHLMNMNLNSNSNNYQNSLNLKENSKLQQQVKEVKEKKKTKRKPRSPKKIMEPIAEKPLAEAELKFDEPYVIELHIDPDDPNPNVCDTMVGDEYQASVPSLVLNKRITTEKREIKSKWNPDNVDREKLVEYFDMLEKKTEIEITNEIAKIKLLKENNLDIEKSLEEVDRNLVYFKGVLKLTKRRGRRSK